jgi:uncharacterized membrane protein YphA (DoxX/SURF4 family)
MPRPTRFDMPAVFLLGAAIATGNPAFADFGIASIVLPALIAVAIFVAVRPGEAPALRWLGALYAAFIFLWYEQYKLFGAPGSIDLFTTITDWLGLHGHEKFMRIGVGCCEITASIFLLIPRVQGLGALGAIMLMSGAIFFHLVSPLGVDPYGDGGILFKEACAVWTAGWLVAYWRRDQLLALAESLHLPVPHAIRRLAA